jgi:hypothetical protein
MFACAAVFIYAFMYARTCIDMSVFVFIEYSYASVLYARKCVCKHCVCIMNVYTCIRISIYVCGTVYL